MEKKSVFYSFHAKRRLLVTTLAESQQGKRALEKDFLHRVFTAMVIRKQPKSSVMFATIAGWVPAIILPTASLLQLVTLLKRKDASGVSALSWLLFALANVGAYFFAEKYWALQSILAFLLTAALNVAIVVVAMVYKD